MSSRTTGTPKKELYRVVVVYFLPTLLVNRRTAGAYTQENSGGSGCPDGTGNVEACLYICRPLLVVIKKLGQGYEQILAFVVPL
jgi:hypothetical protein